MSEESHEIQPEENSENGSRMDVKQLDLRRPLPVIPLRDIVLFPKTVTPILLGRSQTLSSMFRALEAPLHVAFFSLQRDPKEEEIRNESLHDVGVVGHIASSMSLPNNLHKILVESMFPARVVEWQHKDNGLNAVVELYVTGSPETSTVSRQMFHQIRSQFGQYINLNGDLPRDLLDLVDRQPSLEDKLYFVASHLKIAAHIKQLLLDEKELEKKLAVCAELLRNEVEMNSLNRRLEHEVRTSIAQNQREYFLMEQIKKLQLELGTLAGPVNQEVKQFEESVKAKKMPEKIESKLLDEVKRLDHIHPSSPEYGVVRNYVDWFLNLPWNKYTDDILQLPKVKKQLDKDHFGLKEVKERILEYVAVYQLATNHKTPILCFSGPPGVGKTSLAKSIATALNREFVRLSLGGVRDEAEIRGHRRTYIGSMPGRIIQSLKKAQSMNPVLLLDEIDKLGNDFRGDPAAALLEVLDPEQNHEFTDHFMEMGIDLSRVFFITTANVEEHIPPPLRDRLEVIRLSGYYPSEKLHIARDYLLPKVRDYSGLEEKQLSMGDDVLQAVIHRYTREAGVRGLERQLSKVARKRARQVVTSKRSLPELAEDRLPQYLGIPVRQDRQVPDISRPGVVTGLAWTPVGGEILRVECSLLSGKGRLNLTGKMGDVMKESAQIALTLVRERARHFGIDPAIFHRTDIHIHLPEGAIPKDGPSAGIALTLALLSAATRRSIDPKIAFTGEISLVGRIHAVGGLPEKTLAALQAGVREVLVPDENRHDIAELPAEAKKGLHIVRVDHIDKVIGRVLKPSARGTEKVVSRKSS